MGKPRREPAMIRHTHAARAATVPVTTVAGATTTMAVKVQRRRRPAHRKRVSCHDHSLLKKTMDSRVNRVVFGSWAACPYPGERVGLALVVALVVVLVVVLLRRRGVAVLPPVPDDGHLLVVEMLVVLVTVLLVLILLIWMAVFLVVRTVRQVVLALLLVVRSRLLGNAGTVLLRCIELMHRLYWTHFCAFSVRLPCIVLSFGIRAIRLPTTLILWLLRLASSLRLAASVPPVPTLVSAAHSIRGAISPPARALPPPPRCHVYCSARALWCTHALLRSFAPAPVARVAATALIVHAPVSPAAAARPRAPVGSHHRFPFQGSSGIPVKAGLVHLVLLEFNRKVVGRSSVHRV